MIIIKVQGGLGNQIFQYAFGRLLELGYGKEVAYDLTFFKNTGTFTPRPYLLDKFKTHARIATDEEIASIRFRYGNISRYINLVYKALNRYIFKKYYIAYDETLLPKVTKKKDLYIEGYFQSYKYSKSIIETLHEEFILQDISPHVHSLDPEMHSHESVSVHIRRGDYVTTGKDLQPLDMDYYKRAVEELESKVSGPYYYIFSDDPEWVKKEMGDLFHNSTYMSMYELKDYEEFYLMTHVKHAIIANSSFSWWGAMLNLYEGRVIIYPKDWKNIHFIGDTNLCPPEWIAL